MTPQVKIASFTGHVVLNQIQWFILVTFKDYKSGVHELCESAFMLINNYCICNCK
jgi:hypothetical protein